MTERDSEIQSLRAQVARYQIQLSIAEQLIDDPDFEWTAMDLEHETNLHVKLKAALTQQQEAQAVAWTLRWPLDIKRGTVNYMTTFGTKERAREYADKCTDGESIVVAPLILHQPKPTAQPARCEYCDGSGDVHSFDGEWLGSCAECLPAAQPQVPEPCEACHGSGKLVLHGKHGAVAHEYDCSLCAAKEEGK